MSYNHQELETKNDEVARLAALLEKNRQRYLPMEFSVVALELAQKTNDSQYLVEACFFLLLGGHYQECKMLARQIQNCLGHLPLQVARIVGVSMLLDRNFVDAKMVFEALPLESDAPWERLILEQLADQLPSLANLGVDLRGDSRQPLNVRKALHDMSDIFKAQLNFAYVSGHYGRQVICYEARCQDCGNCFRNGSDQSIFSYTLICCPYCIHPYVATPLAMSRALAAKYRVEVAQELVGMDMYLWSWVNNWPEDAGVPEEGRHRFSNNLMALNYHTLRFALGEHYATLYGAECSEKLGSDSKERLGMR